MAPRLLCRCSVLLLAMTTILCSTASFVAAQDGVRAKKGLSECSVLDFDPSRVTPSSSQPTAILQPEKRVGTGSEVVEPDDVCEQHIGEGLPFAKRQATATTSSTINIPASAAIGGLTMTQPPATAQATFYKIARDNYITFGWNFTDVLVAPTSLTLQAYCSQNGFTYPVGPTEGVAGDTTQFAWNPFEYEAGQGATPLAEASYTLRIFRENGYNAAPSPGYMRSYAGTIFALYRPQQYIGLADGWRCAACSAALRTTPIHPAVLATAAAFLMGTVTVWARLR